MKLNVSLITKNSTTTLINKEKKFKFPDKIKRSVHNLKESYELQKEIQDLIDKWLNVMALSNTYNAEFKTYTLTDIEKETYGWSCKIYAPYNHPLEALDKIKASIEGALHCNFLYKIVKNKSFAVAKFVLYEDCNNIKFFPQQVKPWELYLGVDPSGSPVIFDQNIDCHALIVGNTRKGKSKAIDHALTSLICSCSENELELYLIQLLKDDLGIYEDAKQTRCFCDTLQKAVIALEYVVNQITERTNIMKPFKRVGKAGNIMAYNKYNPHNQMPKILVVVDEWGAFIPEAHDNKEIKDLKNQCAAYLCKISQAGASVGITYMIGEQRPTADRIPPFLKNNSNVRVAFGVSTSKGSEVCLDNDMAKDLPPRKAVYYCNGEYNLLYTTALNDKTIYKYIKPHLSTYHKTLFDELKNINETEKMQEEPETKKKGKIKNKLSV